MLQKPLSEMLRPKVLEEVYGQKHLLVQNGLLVRSIEASTPLSLLFFGPPGCGKTSLAKLYLNAFALPKLELSVSEGMGKFKAHLEQSQKNPLFKQKTLVFVDEIHRLNKSQQDLFLPHIESGLITLIAATTENPSFCINNALLSRLRTLNLHPLQPQDLKQIIDKFSFAHSIEIDSTSAKALISLSSGDARHLMNLLENLLTCKVTKVTSDILELILQKKLPKYDKASDEHYSLISALHKSVRSSDPDATLYYLARMLQAGEDPFYILRRLLRMAVEDIGLADPTSLTHTVSALETFKILGSPEGDLVIAQAALYLAFAPKSNASYLAFGLASQDAKENAHAAIPAHLVNPVTPFMKSQGLGNGYVYDHDTKYGVSAQSHMPKELQNRNYYKPTDRGFDREINKRLEFFKKIKKTFANSPGG